MDLDIRFQGIEIFGRRPPSGFGFAITKDGLEGIDDGAPVRGETIARENGDGDYETPLNLDSRIVGLTGVCVAETARDLADLGDDLKGALVESSAPVVFDHLGRKRWGVGRLAPGTTTRFKPVSHTLESKLARAEYSMQIKFADPRLYGEQPNRYPVAGSAAQVTAVHYGNVTAVPVLTVSGSDPLGYSIYGPVGKIYRVTTPLVAGVDHVIDMADGYVRIAGQVVRGGYSIAQRWGVPRGTAVTMTVVPASANGTALMSALVEDTWS
jgi:hypothetical protein